MYKKYTVLFLSTLFITCGNVADTSVSEVEHADGIISLPDGMTIRPHIDWVEWTEAETLKYVDYESQENVMVVDPVLAKTLNEKNIEAHDIVIAGPRAWSTTSVDFADDGTAFVGIKDINVFELVYGKFTVVFYDDGTSTVVPYGSVKFGTPTPKTNSLPVGEQSPLIDVDITGFHRTQKFAVTEGLPAIPISESIGSEICAFNGAICTSTRQGRKYDVVQGDFNTDFDLNGEAHFDAYIPEVAENYNCTGMKQTAGSYEYCIERIALLSRPTFTTKAQYEMSVEGDFKYTVPGSGDLSDPQKDHRLGGVQMGTLPLTLNLIGVVYWGWEFAFSGKSNLAWDAEYQKSFKLGFEYIVPTHPNYPATAKRDQKFFLYPRDGGEAVEERTGSVTSTDEVGFETKLYGGVGIKLTVTPGVAGASFDKIKIGGPGVSMELQFVLGRTTCASAIQSGSGIAASCNDADFSDCGGFRIDLVVKGTAGLQIIADLPFGFEAKVGGVLTEVSKAWNLFTLPGVDKVNCIPNADFKNVRISVVDAYTPRGSGPFEGAVVIDHISLDRRKANSTLVENIKVDSGFSSSKVEEADIEDCDFGGVNSGGVSLLNGNSEDWEFGGGYFGAGSTTLKAGDVIKISPHRVDFMRDIDDPCGPGGTFELSVGDGSRWNKIVGSDGSPIRFQNNGHTSHTITENDLR